MKKSNAKQVDIKPAVIHHCQARPVDKIKSARNVFEAVGILFIENRVKWAEFEIVRVNNRSVALRSTGSNTFKMQYFSGKNGVVDAISFLVENFNMPMDVRFAA